MVKRFNDYVDAVQDHFPYFSKDEISHILEYGFRAYVRANKMHCDVSLTNREEEDVAMTIGRMWYSDKLRFYKKWLAKSSMKERWLWKARKKKWDGYYYIGLTENQAANMTRSGNKITFHNVFLTLIPEELRHQKFIKYIWRVPWLSNCGWKFFVEKLTTEDAEYIGENNYEKYHQCFLGRFNHGYAPDVDEGDSSVGCTECVDKPTDGE